MQEKMTGLNLSNAWFYVNYTIFPVACPPGVIMPLIDEFDYVLPPELVAQYPLAQRDASRLMVLSRDKSEICQAEFRDLPRWLNANDVLVVNDTRVFPARLVGRKASGGKGARRERFTDDAGRTLDPGFSHDPHAR